MQLGVNRQELRTRETMRQSPASKDVNPESNECTTLGAVIKQRLMKTQQAEKS
jgi:hypothetical protein